MKPRALAVCAAILASSSVARAQFPTTNARTVGEPTPSGEGLGITGKLPFWGAGQSRLFLAATFEVGVLSTRETLAFGYGKPHWQWVGVDAYTNFATQGGGYYGGVHVATPYVEARAGTRYAFDIGQYYLSPQDQFTRYDVAREIAPRAKYAAFEGELTFSLPLPKSTLYGIGTVSNFKAIEDGYWIFDDALHVVVEGPWLLRGRIGYFYRFGQDENLRLGAAAELIDDPQRESVTFRVGPILALTLTHHMDLTGSFVVIAAARDELGLLGAEFTTIGLRYRWATGDRWPEFP